MKNLAKQISEKITNSKLFEAGVRVPTPFFIGEVGDISKSILLSYFHNELYEIPGKADKKRVVFLSSKKILDSGDIISNTKTLGFDSFFWLRTDNVEELYLPENKNKAVFIDFETLFTRVIPIENYKESFFEIKKGEKYDIAHQIPDQLVKNGYEKVKKVGSRGEFGVKGDVLEINIFEKQYRIEFFGDEVEKISDLVNEKEFEKIEVYPNKITEGSDFFLKYLDGIS